MSARAIVSLGVWLLLMVLAGTMTVGLALAFYIALTALSAAVVLAVTLVARHRDDRRTQRRRKDAQGEESYL